MRLIKRVITCLILHITARIKGLMNFFVSDFENALVALSMMLQLSSQYQIEFFGPITDSMYAKTPVTDDHFRFSFDI